MPDQCRCSAGPRRRIHRSMLGSCCEVQEAREAHVRKVYRDATRVSEARLFRKTLAADDIRRSLYCTCEHASCEACDAADAPAAAADDAAGSDSEFDDDPVEQAMLEKMRLSRLQQLKSAAAATQQAERSGFGCHQRLGEDELPRLLREPESLLVHLTAPADDQCELVEAEMRQAAVRCKSMRHLTVMCVSGTPPPCLRVSCAIPTILLVTQGEVETSSPVLEDLREPRRLQAAVSTWLDSIHLDVRRRQRGQKEVEDGSDEEQDDSSYCGRPGCRSYPHEHLGWGDVPK
ncbi:hypothetical protein AB1Y20_004123 [Prymnesium parvum]|uniref:Phosducin thioredoxin-like domain-containing protein n=1 Tax=Prymnesium parvum TaxID=97485 RepID=A0AB34J8X3_PRYPA